ncbi:MAG: hypothetical protein GX768_09675 [Chloroflexi bacterium]|nr:hypothetical protein [Chloroflexota bacterium]
MDRLLMNMVRGMMRRTKDKDGIQNEMTAAMKNSYNHSSREFVEPLVSYVKTL